MNNNTTHPYAAYVDVICGEKINRKHEYKPKKPTNQKKRKQPHTNKAPFASKKKPSSLF